jgi:hypothetical protein
MAPMRRTRVFRAVGWLVCWLIEIPSIDDVDQAALDAHIAAVAGLDREAARVRDEPGAGALEPAVTLLRGHRTTRAQAQ